MQTMTILQAKARLRIRKKKRKELKLPAAGQARYYTCNNKNPMKLTNTRQARLYIPPVTGRSKSQRSRQILWGCRPGKTSEGIDDYQGCKIG